MAGNTRPAMVTMTIKTMTSMVIFSNVVFLCFSSPKAILLLLLIKIQKPLRHTAKWETDEDAGHLWGLYHFEKYRSHVQFCSYLLILSRIEGDFKPHLLRQFHKFFFFRKIGSPLSTKKTSRANHLGNLVWNFISSKMSRKMGLKPMTSAQKPWIWKNIHKPKLNKISAGNELHSMIRRNVKRNW